MDEVPKIYTIIARIDTTRVESIYNPDLDDYVPHRYSASYLDITRGNHADVLEQFKLEDGDGDETGSHSRNVIFVLNGDRIIFDAGALWEEATRCEDRDIYNVAKDNLLEHMRNEIERIAQQVSA